MQPEVHRPPSTVFQRSNKGLAGPTTNTVAAIARNA